MRAVSEVWKEADFFCEIFEILYFCEKHLENAAKKQKEWMRIISSSRHLYLSSLAEHEDFGEVGL